MWSWQPVPAVTPVFVTAAVQLVSAPTVLLAQVIAFAPEFESMVQLVGASTVLTAFIGKRFPGGIDDVFQAVPRYIVFEGVEA